jgi:hypothetical protein
VTQVRRIGDSPVVVGLPSLGDLVTRPDLVEQLPVDACETLAIQAATLQARLLTRIARADARVSAGSTELLDVKAAAKQLGLAEDTLYRKVRRDPSYRAMTVDNGTDRVVFDPRKVKAFIARRVR